MELVVATKPIVDEYKMKNNKKTNVFKLWL